VSALCLGAALAVPAYAQQPGGQQQSGQQQPLQYGQPGQQQSGQQAPPQQFGQQGPQQFGQGMPQAPQQRQYGPGYQAQQQGLSEERIRQFFNQLAQTIEQAAREHNPAMLSQFLRNHMADDAVITVANELYLGNTMVAQTMAQLPEDTLTDALGTAAPGMHGRRLVQDYNIDFKIRDVRPVPGANMARVFATVSESGRFMVAEAANRVAGIRQRFAEMGTGGSNPQMNQMQSGMSGQTYGQNPSQQAQAQQMQQGQAQQQTPYQGQVQGWSRQLPSGAPESLRFVANANCIFDVVQEGNDIKIGNTFCRGETRLS